MLTVFTSSYNHGKFLDAAIQSVLAQTYRDFEYLIYDDGSTDNTWDVIQKYNDSRIKAVKLDKTANLATVINKSLEIYQGDAWLWCPADDVWLPNLLDVKVKYHEEYPNSISYSDWEIIDGEDNHICKRKGKRCTPKEYRNDVWSKRPVMGFTGIYIPRPVFDLVGLFPEHWDCSEDFCWMVKSCADGVDYRCIPQILYYKRKHGNTESVRNSATVDERVSGIMAEVIKYKESL